MSPTPVECAVSDALSVLAPGTVLLAAVSGGADSTALLHASALAARRLGLVLNCLHVDHGIRPAEERSLDVAFVETLCESLGTPLILERIPEGKIARIARDEGIGVEAAARNMRHAAFLTHARAIGAAHILVAHTADDQLENILIRVLRGSGPEGLALMETERPPLLRPLLGVGRREVLAYLAANGLGFRTDSTNADVSYFRNRVRLRLCPFLDAEFPAWRQGLLSLAGTQSNVASFIREEAVRRLSPVYDPSGAAHWEEARFFSESEILREQALFAALDALEERAAKGTAVIGQPREFRRATLALFCSGTVTSLDLGGYHLKRDNATVMLALSGKRGESSGFSLRIARPGSYQTGGMELSVIPEAAPPAIPIGLPVMVRPEETGDRIPRGGRLRRCRTLRGEADSASSSRGFVIEDRAGIAAYVLVRSGLPAQIWKRDAASGTGAFIDAPAGLIISGVVN